MALLSKTSRLIPKFNRSRLFVSPSVRGLTFFLIPDRLISPSVRGLTLFLIPDRLISPSVRGLTLILIPDRLISRVIEVNVISNS